MPGAKGGWITVRDAVKKALPKDAAEARQVPPAGRRAASAGRSRRSRRRRARDGTQGHHPRRQGSRLGRRSNDDIFGLEPRDDLIQRCVVWQLAKRRAGTHKVKNRAEIARTGKKMYKQKGTGGARHGSRARQPVPRRRPVVRSASAQPCDRPAQEGARAGAAPRALRQGQGRRHRRARRRCRLTDAKTKALPAQFEQARARQRADHRRRRDRRELRPRRPQHPEHRRAAGPGHQRLRHSAARRSWC